MSSDPKFNRYEEANKAFHSESILKADDDTLLRHLYGLSNYPVRNEMLHPGLVVRGLTINHVLLQRHIEKLDRRATVLQWIVITLTALAVLVGGVQIWVAFNPPKQESAAQAQSSSASATREQATPK